MSSHWFSLNLKEYPRSMTKTEWKEISRHLRLVRRIMEHSIDFEYVSSEVTKAVCDLALNGHSALYVDCEVYGRDSL